MAFLDDCLAHERDQRDQKVREELYDRFTLGKADAAFGRMPEYSDELYLEGYFAGLKTLPTDPETGKIQHYSPRSHFAFGMMDGVDECHCDF